jgi:hypothetical protein
MSKVQSTIHNFANQVTSGLSDFVLLAYESCERAKISTATFTLTPILIIPGALASEVDLKICVEGLSRTFIEILGKESDLPLTEVKFLIIGVDFELDSLRVQQKRRHLANHRMSYAHDPIYSGGITIRLRSGREHHVPIRSHDA